VDREIKLLGKGAVRLRGSHGCADSISSNIAEGQGRRTSRDFLHFLGIARGSLAEIETQLFIAARLGYIHDADEAALNATIVELHRILNGLISSLQRRSG
jgi:four helix bundle protein